MPRAGLSLADIQRLKIKLLYAQERVQFGKPISRQQSIAFKIADMYAKIRAARFLVYSAAWHKFHHMPYGIEAAAAKVYEIVPLLIKALHK